MFCFPFCLRAEASLAFCFTFCLRTIALLVFCFVFCLAGSSCGSVFVFCFVWGTDCSHVLFFVSFCVGSIGFWRVGVVLFSVLFSRLSFDLPCRKRARGCIPAWAVLFNVLFSRLGFNLQCWSHASCSSPARIVLLSVLFSGLTFRYYVEDMRDGFVLLVNVLFSVLFCFGQRVQIAKQAKRIWLGKKRWWNEHRHDLFDTYAMHVYEVCTTSFISPYIFIALACLIQWINACCIICLFIPHKCVAWWRLLPFLKTVAKKSFPGFQVTRYSVFLYLARPPNQQVFL